jgi:hypothetical protein
MKQRAKRALPERPHTAGQVSSCQRTQKAGTASSVALGFCCDLWFGWQGRQQQLQQGLFMTNCDARACIAT